MTWSASRGGSLSEKSKIWGNTYFATPFCQANAAVLHVSVCVGLCGSVWVRVGLGEMEGCLARHPRDCHGGYLRRQWDAEWK